MAILRYLILINFLILLPLGQIIRIDLGNSVSLVPLDLGVALTFLSFVLFNRKIIKTSLTIPVAIFMGALALSLLFNFNNLEPKQFLVSGLYLVRLISYFSIYFLIMTYKNLKQSLPRNMLISGGTLLLIGFVQYIFYPNLRNLYYLGWDEHLYRLFSSFLDPNFAGTFFVLLFIFLIGSLNKNKIKYILSALTLLAVFLTYSRSAYLMLAVGVLTFLIKKKRFKQAAILIFLFLIALGLLTKTPISSEGTNLLRTASAEARLDSAKNAIIIFKNNPIIGVGFNSYRYAQHKYGFLNKNWENIHSGAGTDNSFLFILATSGVVGFLAYIYLLFKIIKLSILSKSKYSIILFASIIGLIVDSLFVNSLFYPPILLWLMALLGLTESR